MNTLNISARTVLSLSDMATVTVTIAPTECIVFVDGLPYLVLEAIPWCDVTDVAHIAEVFRLLPVCVFEAICQLLAKADANREAYVALL